MKQSLKAFLPKIVSSSFNEIINLHGTKILFDQNSKISFGGNVDIKKPIYFLLVLKEDLIKMKLKLLTPKVDLVYLQIGCEVRLQ